MSDKYAEVRLHPHKLLVASGSVCERRSAGGLLLPASGGETAHTVLAAGTEAIWEPGQIVVVPEGALQVFRLRGDEVALVHKDAVMVGYGTKVGA